MTKKKKPEDKKTAGVESTYNQAVATEICERIAHGQSLRKICADEHMPAVRTIFNWFHMFPEFLQQYTRAKQEQAEAFAEEILDIADESSNDFIEDAATGLKKLNSEHVQRARLRIDTRKWLMSKMMPKKYGDKLDVEQNGSLTIITKQYSKKDDE